MKEANLLKLYDAPAKVGLNDMLKNLGLFSRELHTACELMEQYAADKVPAQSVIDYIQQFCEEKDSLHFNLNTDIKRLLICRYPYKIMLSATANLWEFNEHELSNNPSLLEPIKVTWGILKKQKAYEENVLESSTAEIKAKIGDAKIVGTYGQLSFTDDRSKKEIELFFATFLEALGPLGIAICHSGSLLGVSGIAYAEGKKRNIPTIGIVPNSIKHLINKHNFTHLITEGDDWGDASFMFGALPWHIIFAGGGYWSYL